MYETKYTALAIGVIAAFLVVNVASTNDVFAPVAIIPDIAEQSCSAGLCQEDSVADKQNKGQQGDIASEGKRQGHGGPDNNGDEGGSAS